MNFPKILLFLGLILASIHCERLYAVGCSPECYFFSLDSQDGHHERLSPIGKFLGSYVRPNVITSDRSTGEIFWTFPEAPQGTLYSYEPSSNKSRTFPNIFSSGIITMQGDQQGGLYIISQAKLSLFNVQNQAVTPVADLSSQIGGHEWCSAFDVDQKLFYVTGEDLTAKNGNVTQVDVVKKTFKESPYSRWVTPGMGYSHGTGLVLIVVEQNAGKTFFAHYDFNSHDLDILYNVGGIVERAFLTINQKTGMAYFFIVPNTLFTYDLNAKKIVNKVSLDLNFSTYLLGITSLSQ